MADRLGERFLLKSLMAKVAGFGATIERLCQHHTNLLADSTSNLHTFPLS